MIGKSGIIYYCTGRHKYLGDAIESAKSVRKHSPSLGITLFHEYSNIPHNYDLSVFSEVVLLDVSEMADIKRMYKGTDSPVFLKRIRVLLKSPYERTLFLDADAKILKSIDDLFTLLDRFDLVLAPGPMTQQVIDSSDVMSKVPRTFPECNCGVMLYRMNDITRKLFTEWFNVYGNNVDGLWRRHGRGGDQVSLRYMIWKLPEVKFYVFSFPTIPNIFNYRWKELTKQFSYRGKVFIQHHHQVHKGTTSAHTQ